MENANLEASLVRIFEGEVPPEYSSHEKDFTQVLELEHQHDWFIIKALTRGGFWLTVFQWRINSKSVLDDFHLPLLIKLGYTHKDQSGLPNELGESLGVMPQTSEPLHSCESSEAR